MTATPDPGRVSLLTRDHTPNPGDQPHPAWCRRDVCTAGYWDGYHVTDWHTAPATLYGDPRFQVRAYLAACDTDTEPPRLELIVDRPAGTSVEGYELDGEQARQLAAILTSLTTITRPAGDPGATGSEGEARP